MINCEPLLSATRDRGFVLVTILVFITVISLLTLNIIQQATQDLLLAANVQQRMVASQAVTRELYQLRKQLADTPPVHVQSLETSALSVRSTPIGCYASPWVPLDRSQTTSPVTYQLYKATVSIAGGGSRPVQALAIVAVALKAETCPLI